jgi:tetratricopeptide (TPR) repeat protein
VLLEQAESRAADGGGDFAGRLAQCRVELEVLRELDRIDTLRWTVTNGQWTDRNELATLRAAALDRLCAHAGARSADEVVAAVQASALRERLLAALDARLAAAPADDLLAVLAAADPDEYRTAVRGAVRAGDAGRLRDLAARPDALAQPVWFAVTLGEHDGLAMDRRRQILLAAQMRQPNNFSVLMALGAPDMHDPEQTAAEGVRWSQAALAVRPQNPVVWNRLGGALYHANDLDGAETALRRAVALDPRFVWALSNLGNILKSNGDLTGSLAAHREAVRLDPLYVRGHNNLGVALKAAGDLTGAVAAYHEAIRLDPSYAKVHGNLGLALAEMGDLTGAVAAYKEALRLNPGYARVYYDLGRALARLGDWHGAAESHRRAVELDPTNVNYQNALDSARAALANSAPTPEPA